MINVSSIYNAQNGGSFPLPLDDSSINSLNGKAGLTHGANSSQSQDQVSISDQGKGFSVGNSTGLKQKTNTVSTSTSDTSKSQTQGLSPQQLAEIQQLKTRDADVKAHELAHLAVAGRFATGGASFTYQTGPDGVRYAIGGEVPIDISSESTPEATIQKMETIKRAALAPADPSAADRRIAAEAAAKELQASQELQTQQRDNASSEISSTPSNNKDNEKASASSSADTFSPLSNGLSAGNNQHIMIKTYQAIQALA